METYARFCPLHRVELQAVTPVMDYPHHAEELWSAPELHCEEGNHMVGRACDTDHWLVIHKPTGLICYEANEDGSRFVNSPVLLVEPEDVEPRRVMVEGIATRPDAQNWKGRNLYVARGVADGNQ